MLSCRMRPTGARQSRTKIRIPQRQRDAMKIDPKVSGASSQELATNSAAHSK